MSQWIHVRGCLELMASAYERKDGSDGVDGFYLPYPEKQFKLPMPRLGRRADYSKEKDENGMYPTEYYLCFQTAYVYSLPRAKKYIEEAFELLPQGESGIRYSLSQTDADERFSHSDFIYPCLAEYYRATVDKMYRSDNPWHSKSYEELVKYGRLGEECCVAEVSNILVGVRSDLRDTSGVEFKDALKDFVAYLNEHGICIVDGYLEWEDEYDAKRVYAFRVPRSSLDVAYEFLELDADTNRTMRSESYTHKKRPDGGIDWDADGFEIAVKNFE